MNFLPGIAGVHGAARGAQRMEELRTYGLNLGLTEEQVRHCIKRESDHARESLDPFRWHVARDAMVAAAFAEAE